MKKSILLTLGFLLVLLISSCVRDNSSSIQPKPITPLPQDIRTREPGNTDPGMVVTENPLQNDRPVSSGDGSSDDSSPYFPQADDRNKTRSEAYISAADLLIAESIPPQPFLHVSGELPTPCHELRIAISPPDSKDHILVDVYAVIESEKICAQVIEPFEITVPLANIPSGQFVVFVNGIKVAGLVMP